MQTFEANSGISNSVFQIKPVPYRSMEGLSGIPSVCALVCMVLNDIKITQYRFPRISHLLHVFSKFEGTTRNIVISFFKNIPMVLSAFCFWLHQHNAISWNMIGTGVFIHSLNAYHIKRFNLPTLMVLTLICQIKHFTLYIHVYFAMPYLNISVG